MSSIGIFLFMLNQDLHNYCHHMSISEHSRLIWRLRYAGLPALAYRASNAFILESLLVLTRK